MSYAMLIAPPPPTISNAAAFIGIIQIDSTNEQASRSI
jgi:hypothetical protein